MCAIVIASLVGTGFVGLKGSGGTQAADLGVAPGSTSAPTGAATPSEAVGAQVLLHRVMGADQCRAARKGLRWYRGWFRYWTHKMGAAASRETGRGSQHRSPSCPRYLSKVFRAKALRARKAYEAWYVYHYHWWEWLPANWQALGACETGYGKRPGNFEHTNSRFTSAFGISWAVYNSDAAAGGAPPWHVRHTPRDQYNAALAHLRIYGDGWTCPGP